jgi:hypothetical protein
VKNPDATCEADSPDHAAAWIRLRRLMRAQAFLILGFAPAVLGLAALVLRVSDSPTPIYAFEIAWLGALALTSALGLAFRCPRCAKRFFVRGLRSRVRERACLHCGLPIRIPRAW